MIRPILFVIAVLLVLFGFSGLYMLPKLINQKIEQKMQIKIGTKLFDRFQNIPVALSIKFRFLNITNKEEVLAGLERPKFQEVGPFVYEERRKRYVVDIEDNGRKLRFRESKFFYSSYEKYKQQQLDQAAEIANASVNVQSESNASLPMPNKESADEEPMLDPKTTNITTINVPLLAVLTKLANLPEGSLKRSLASKVAQRLVEDGHDKILVTRTASELLFDGYKVDFLEAARKLFESLGYNFESPLLGNKFGFYYTKNGTWTKLDNGEYVIWTGRHGSMAEFPQITSWNDQTVLNVWPNDTKAGDRCNRVHGTDGASFHPNLSRHQTLYVFSPLICTSIYFKYQFDSQVNGIPVWRFTTPAEVFAASGKNERKQCYCTIKQPGSSASSLATPAPTLSTSLGASEFESEDAPIGQDSIANSMNPLSSTSGSITPTKTAINNSRCFIDGIVDLSLCQKGAPIAVSGAFFYNADPMLALATGLKPERAKHETYIEVEPMTGQVMRAKSRAQLNAFVEEAAISVVDSNVIGHMTPMLAPLVWLEEGGGIDENLAGEFKSRLLNLVQKVRRTCMICIVSGLVLIALISVHYWYTTCYQIDLKSHRDRMERKRGRSDQTKSSIKMRASLDGDDVTNTNQSKTRNLLNNFAGTDAVAGAMGAIGAETPISLSDKHRLIDDEDANSDNDNSEDQDGETSAKLKQHQNQQPTTSQARDIVDGGADAEARRPLFDKQPR